MGCKTIICKVGTILLRSSFLSRWSYDEVIICMFEGELKVMVFVMREMRGANKGKKRKKIVKTGYMWRFFPILGYVSFTCLLSLVPLPFFRFISFSFAALSVHVLL